MLEIFLILKLISYIGKSASDKGLKKFSYQLMAVLLWICLETAGIIIAPHIFDSIESKWPGYVLGLVGGFIGAGLSLLIMRIIPGEDSQSQITVSDDNSEITYSKGFSRSVWIPVIVIGFAVSCCLLSFGIINFQHIFKSSNQIRAADPIIGIELDERGKVVQYNNDIPSETETIYFGFDLHNPSNQEILVTCYWFIDGKLEYYVFTTTQGGQIIILFDRIELDIPEYKKGDYEVLVYLEERFLLSTTYVVK